MYWLNKIYYWYKFQLFLLKMSLLINLKLDTGFIHCFYWRALLWFIVVSFICLSFITLINFWFYAGSSLALLLRCAFTSDILSLHLLGESVLDSLMSSCLDCPYCHSEVPISFPLLLYCVKADFLGLISSSFLLHFFVLWNTLSRSYLRKSVVED